MSEAAGTAGAAQATYEQSVALYRDAGEVLAGGVSSNFRLGGQPAPLFFERAAGARLYDADGNVYLDYVLGMGPCILGHAPPAVTAAVAATLSQGQLFAGQHRGEIELARRFCALVPCAERVRFGSSGSEMVQAALRVARAATGRRLVLKFEGHYHGWFDTILVSVQPPLEAVGRVGQVGGRGLEPAGRADAPQRHLPSAGQSLAAAEDVAVLPWNDAQVVEDFLAARGQETAALIMEPILCNTGVILPRPGYLERVRRLCDRHGVVLIFDEVITGFRVGPGGAQGRLGVLPDLAVYAKALGAGFPIAALAGRQALMERLGDGSTLHGGTYNTNLVSTSAAIAALGELGRGGGAVYGALEARGESLKAGLREGARRAGVPLLVQGLGAVFNTAFWPQGTGPNGAPSRESREADSGADGAPLAGVSDYRAYAALDASRQRAFLRALQDGGVRVTARGTWFLSTAHSDADVEETLRVAERALRAV